MVVVLEVVDPDPTQLIGVLVVVGVGVVVVVAGVVVLEVVDPDPTQLQYTNFCSSLSCCCSNWRVSCSSTFGVVVLGFLGPDK